MTALLSPRCVASTFRPSAFDFPEGASREIGVFLALIGAMAVAGGAGDYAPLRGAPWFPKTSEAGTRTK